MAGARRGGARDSVSIATHKAMDAKAHAGILTILDLHSYLVAVGNGYCNLLETSKWY